MKKEKITPAPEPVFEEDAYLTERLALANQGYAYAQYDVAKYYEAYLTDILEALTDDLDQPLGLNEINPNYIQSHTQVLYTWYKLAADQGHAKALYEIAKMYENDGINMNHKLALSYYKQAAERYHTGACHALGRMYELGKGTLPDFNTAARYYQEAADEGCELSQYSLKLMTENDLIPLCAPTPTEEAMFTYEREQAIPLHAYKNEQRRYTEDLTLQRTGISAEKSIKQRILTRVKSWP